MKIKMLCGVAAILVVVWAGVVLAQSENEAISLANEAKTIFDSAKSKEDYQRAAQKYEEALKINERVKSDKGIGLCSYQLGRIQFRLGQYQKALEYYEQSLAISKKVGNTTGEAASLSNIGIVYKNLGQYTKALGYFEQSLQISRKIRDVKGEGNTLGDLGEVYGSLGQYTKALDYYEQSLAINKKTGNVISEGSNLSSLGTVYKNLGQYTRALDYHERSLAIRKKIGDVRGEGDSLGNIGIVCNHLGQYTKALEYYEQCLQIKKKIGDVKGEGNTFGNIGEVYSSLGQYTKALGNYEQSLAITKKIGDVRGQGDNLSSVGWVYFSLGQYTRALDYYERSLETRRKIGDIRGEGSDLNKIGVVFKNLGQYNKALGYYEQSLTINKKIGNVSGEVANLNNIGAVYSRLGQYAKALDYYDQSLQIEKKIGDAKGEGLTLGSMGQLYAATGKNENALDAMKQSIEINEKLGIPSSTPKIDMANLFLDMGDFIQAENLTKQTGHNSTLGRLALLRSDYPSAATFYEKAVRNGEKTGNADVLFTSYTGLARTYEGLEDYPKAEEYYEKAMNLVEDIRSGLLPSERKNFFEVKIGGFTRSDPARGLTRVRMKLNRADGSIDSSEVTRARAFSDHLSEISSTGSTGVPKETPEKEQSLVNRLAALKKELAKTNKENQSAKYEILTKDVKDAQTDLKAFIETLWKQNPAYAAVKYPQPVTLKGSALKPDECAVIFDVSGEGVGVKLIRNKTIAETFFKKWDQKDLENDVKKFRESFEKVRFREFNIDLAESLYRKLLLRVLDDVPKGTPLIIIPDGILSLLPFEALVTGGKVNWNKGEFGVDNPEGLTFLGDEHPISYYQSITALTLTRTMGNKDKPGDKLLVLADPVFEMKDQRAQQAGSTKLAERDKQNNLQLMQIIEDTSEGSFRFDRLPETGILADNLDKMYGSNCLSLTGLQANKADFLSKIAPTIDQYGSVVFATHGVMSTHIPGLMEPFLALAMAPPGTDGFLKMSDILSLKMNADVVALTACQSGLGKELSGEGVMSMGRAFQYAGAKSVLMSLWEVEEKSAVTLAENFFRYRKEGKTKLDSLKSARDDIRKAGYIHPFFWSAFILVGETS
jgi:tetratricopeptide (TPR) repeat protein